MQYDVGTTAGFAAGVEIADVRFDETMTPPAIGTDRASHLVEIAPVAGREIVQPNNDLVEYEQRLHQVRPDETCASRDEPTSRSPRKLLSNFVDRGHDHNRIKGARPSRQRPLVYARRTGS